MENIFSGLNIKAKSHAGQWFKASFSLCVAMLLISCQSSPLARYAGLEGFDLKTVQGQGFKHLLVHNASLRSHLVSHALPVKASSDPSILNVYIEGDGRPWHRPDVVAWDPTPEHSLMLPLMELDRSPALFLGRPCYFGTQDPACEAIWWTHKRYAPQVVQSMSAVLDTLTPAFEGLRLIGHSGGGALAMLLAAKRQDVVAVVTLAGNLDTGRWTALHGYSPLEGSLDPRDFPVPASTRQLHFVGEDDAVTPPDLIRAALKSPDALVVYEGMDHRCCWTEVWPGILRQMASNDAQ